MEEIVEIIIGIIITFMLLGNSILDIKKREISLALCLCCLIPGLAIILVSGYRSVFLTGLGIIPGLFMVLAAVFSKGKVGIGDGIVIMVLGLLWGLYKTFLAVFLSLSILAIVSIVMLAIKRWNISTRLPYIPFLCGASGLVGLFMESGI